MSRAELFRAAVLAVIAVLVLASYEIARPAAESIFVAEHGVEALPKAWLAIAAGVALTVAAYNRVVARLSLDKVAAGAALTSIALLALVQLARSRELPGSAYLLYVWKDVYIVVLVEAFWSIANNLFHLKTARRVYGLLCAAGSVGGILGARVLRWGTAHWGTDQALWLVVPALLGIALASLAVGRVSPLPAPKAKDRAPLGQGLKLLRGSSYLVLMLLLVLLGQILMNLLDYQFQDIAATAFPDKDARTAQISRVYEAISYGALTLQLLTAFIVRLLGVRGVLVGVPALFGAASLALLFSPGFLVAAASKVTSKVLDYSVFRAAKEMLYLPLGYEEKTQGKAIIDILTYRLAKGGAALMLQGLISLSVTAMVAPLSVLVAVAWATVALVLGQRYRALTSQRASPPEG
jgi:AAA family ATP:ADP antiporter